MASIRWYLIPSICLLGFFTFLYRENLYSKNLEKPHSARQVSMSRLHNFLTGGSNNQENDSTARLSDNNDIISSSAKYAGSNGRGRMLKMPMPDSFPAMSEVDRMQGFNMPGPGDFQDEDKIGSSRFSQGSTYSTFDKFNFDGSIPETFQFATTNDEIFNAMSAHEITALNSGDNELYNKVYKHKQLTYIALWSASSPKNKIVGQEKYEDPSYGLITEYGCWCLPNQYSNFTAGYGTPLDKIDTACRDRSRCARCATSEFNHCQATSGYAFDTFQDLSGKRGITCEKNPVGSCQRALCECDAAFVDSIGVNYLQWDEKYSSNQGKFDRISTCGKPAHQVSATTMATTTTTTTAAATTTTVATTTVPQAVPDDYFDWLENDNSNSFDQSDYHSNTDSDDYYSTYETSNNFDNNYGFISYDDEASDQVSSNNPDLIIQSVPKEQQNFEDLFGDYAGIASDLINAEEESESAGMPDHNLVFNPLSGKWETMQEDDIIYDQFNYDDYSEQHDGDVSHYLYFPPHVVSKLKVSNIGDSVDQSAIQEIHPEWSGKLLNAKAHDPSDYSAVYDYYYSFNEEENNSERGISEELFSSSQSINNGQTCCGEYPRRFPYVPSEERKCCRFGTFNPTTHSCCGDHVLLGSTCE